MVALVYNWETIKTPQAWLAGTIRHKCLLYWRQRRRRLYQTVDTVLLELVADGEQPRQERLDLINDLNALISRLPPRCQELLRLRYGLGMGINEVAEEMGYQRGSVSKVTARCLAALNREMVLAGFFSKGAAARLSPLERACLGR